MVLFPGQTVARLPQIIKNPPQPLAGGGADRKNLFTAAQPQPSFRPVGTSARTVDLGDDTDDGAVGAGGDVGRKETVILGGAYQQSHHIRFVGIQGQRPAQPLGFGIFSCLLYTSPSPRD